MIVHHRLDDMGDKYISWRIRKRLIDDNYKDKEESH